MGYETIKTVQLETPGGVRQFESEFVMKTGWLDRQKQG